MVLLDQLLESCVYHEGSDLHIKADSPPLVRIYGDLLPMEMDPLTADEVRWLCFLLGQHQPRLRRSTLPRRLTGPPSRGMVLLLLPAHRRSTVSLIPISIQEISMFAAVQEDGR